MTYRKIVKVKRGTCYFVSFTKLVTGPELSQTDACARWVNGTYHTRKQGVVRQCGQEQYPQALIPAEFVDAIPALTVLNRYLVVR